MKIRSGFVSNSSSASFTVRWRPINSDLSVKENIEELFNYNDIYSDEDIKKAVAYLNKHTEQTSCKCCKCNEEYTSSFWTSMYNGFDSWGEEVVMLVAAAQIEGVLIETKVDED